MKALWTSKDVQCKAEKMDDDDQYLSHITEWSQYSLDLLLLYNAS